MAVRTKAAGARARTPARARLTPYESSQVEQIAAWKSRPPNALAEIIRRVTHPVADLAEKVIPDAVVRAAIDQSFALAARFARQEDTKRRAGIDDLKEMRRKALEECDRLALSNGGLFAGFCDG